MTLGEAVKKAVSEQDAQKAGRIVDILRFRHGFDYEDCAQLFSKFTDGECSPQKFECLMYEADAAE